MSETPRSKFEHVLKSMNHKGGFQSAMLATIDGLPLAAAPASREPETAAATVALVKGVINRARSMLRLDQVDEVTLVDGNRTRLVCRYFSHEGEDFILAVMAPPDASYRRVTAEAIRAIKATLSG